MSDDDFTLRDKIALEIIANISVKVFIYSNSSGSINGDPPHQNTSIGEYSNLMDPSNSQIDDVIDLALKIADRYREKRLEAFK